MSSAGRRGREKSLEQHEKRQHERQTERAKIQAELQEAYGSNNEPPREWMESIINVEDLEERLQESTIQSIQGLLSKQNIISNLDEAETFDRRWWLEVQKYKIYGTHPPPESVIQGNVRAELMGDKQESRRALSQRERNTVDQIIQTLKNMLTRARGGFERKQQNTSIAHSETANRDDSEESGRLRGLF